MAGTAKDRSRRRRPKRPIDPYSPKKLDEELKGLLAIIPRFDPAKRPKWLDEKQKKVFAINFARILSHHNLSCERAARLLRSNMNTVIAWLNALGNRSTYIVENLGRHLGLGPAELSARVLSFNEIEPLTLGEGWRPTRSWHQAPRSPDFDDNSDDDDPADFWKKGGDES
jgi:hypothetical protein